MKISLSVVVASALMSQSLAQSPSIEAQAINLHFMVPSNGDIKLQTGSVSRSIVDSFSDLDSAVSLQQTLSSQVSTTTSQLNAAIVSLNARIDDHDHDEIAIMSAAIDANAANLDAYSTLTKQLTANITELRGSIQTVSNKLSNKKNPACIADMLLATPVNTEPIKGSCSVTVNGTCTIGCKTGYSSLTDTNVALGKSAVTNDPSKILKYGNTKYNPGKALDGINGNSLNRFVRQCAADRCTLSIDLGSNYTGITQFRFTDGHLSCTQDTFLAGTCQNSPSQFTYCKHYIQVWRGDPTTTLVDADKNLDSEDWVTMISYEIPSLFGEEHDVVRPLWAQYVRLLVDNRPSVECKRVDRYLRIFEFEVLQGSTRDYTCGEDGLTAVKKDDVLDCIDRTNYTK